MCKITVRNGREITVRNGCEITVRNSCWLIGNTSTFSLSAFQQTTRPAPEAFAAEFDISRRFWDNNRRRLTRLRPRRTASQFVNAAKRSSRETFEISRKTTPCRDSAWRSPLFVFLPGQFERPHVRYGERFPFGDFIRVGPQAATTREEEANEDKNRNKQHSHRRGAI